MIDQRIESKPPNRIKFVYIWGIFGRKIVFFTSHFSLIPHSSKSPRRPAPTSQLGQAVKTRVPGAGAAAGVPTPAPPRYSSARRAAQGAAPRVSLSAPRSWAKCFPRRPRWRTTPWRAPRGAICPTPRPMRCWTIRICPRSEAVAGVRWSRRSIRIWGVRRRNL